MAERWAVGSLDAMDGTDSDSVKRCCKRNPIVCARGWGDVVGRDLGGGELTLEARAPLADDDAA